MQTIEIIGIVIAAVATILTGVWFIVQKAQKFAVNEYRLDNLDKDAAKHRSESEEMKKDMLCLKSDVSLLQREMSEVRVDIFDIKTILVKQFPNVLEAFSMKKSPRVLNELGNQIFSQINGAEFLETNKSFFFRLIDERKPKTALDVEISARVVCVESSNDDIFNDIKLFVYNAPSMTIPTDDGKSKRYDLSLEDICYILSLPLRDMYLEAHPDIER